MKKIGALWVKMGKSGRFLSGQINDEDILIFKNNRKRNDKSPDYIVYIREERQPAKQQDDVPFETEVDDDLPF